MVSFLQKRKELLHPKRGAALHLHYHHHMRTFFFSLLFISLLSANLSAQNQRQWYAYQAAKVSFWYPEAWVLEAEEGSVIIRHPQTALSMTFTLLPDTQLEGALAQWHADLSTQLTDARWSVAPDLVQLNNLLGVGGEIEGTLEGKAVKIGLFLLERPQGVLLLVGMGFQGALDEQRETLDRIVQSIQPL